MFAELLTETAAFEKAWKTRTPSTARTEAADLLKCVTDTTTENAAIILKRAEVAKIILQVQAHLAMLDLAFKRLAKGMDRQTPAARALEIGCLAVERADEQQQVIGHHDPPKPWRRRGRVHS